MKYTCTYIFTQFIYFVHRVLSWSTLKLSLLVIKLVRRPPSSPSSNWNSTTPLSWSRVSTSHWPHSVRSSAAPCYWPRRSRTWQPLFSIRRWEHSVYGFISLWLCCIATSWAGSNSFPELHFLALGKIWPEFFQTNVQSIAKNCSVLLRTIF